MGWFFGDGGSAADGTATHKWKQDGTYRVTLRIGRDGVEVSAFKDFVIDPRSIGKASSGPVAQRSPAPDIPDLVLWSPQAGSNLVTITAHRPGEIDPLVAPLQIQPLGAGELRLVPAVLGQLKTDGPATIVVEAGGNDPQPLMAIYQNAGPAAAFGDFVAGNVVQGSAASAASAGKTTLTHVIGLNDDAARTSDFGVSNASPRRTHYNLRFLDNLGKVLDERLDQELPAFGHLLLDSETLRQRGINGESDYRVEIETLEGGPLVPFGNGRRLGSNDLSYLPGMQGGAGRQYLMALIAGPSTVKGKGKGKASPIDWATDLLLVNTGDAAMTVNVRFVGLVTKGLKSRPASIGETVQAGDSVRLVDVVRGRLGVLAGAGMLVVESAGAGGSYPLVLGETYNVIDRRFGQTAGAQNDSELIHAGQTRLLFGLREDSLFRSALSFFNPGGGTAKAQLVYRGANGAVLSKINVSVGAGKLVQQGARDGGALKKSFSGLFTIEVNATSGDLLVGGQLVRKSTGDTSFVASRALP